MPKWILAIAIGAAVGMTGIVHAGEQVGPSLISQQPIPEGAYKYRYKGQPASNFDPDGSELTPSEITAPVINVARTAGTVGETEPLEAITVGPATAGNSLVWDETTGLRTVSAADPFELVRAATRLPCQALEIGLAELSERLPGTRSKRNWVRYSATGMDTQPRVFRIVFEVGVDDQLNVEFTGPMGDPGYITTLYQLGAMRRPYLLARTEGGCTIHTARVLTYDVEGRPEWLQDADDRLRPVGQPEPLNPPVPAGNDPPGIPVGVVDSGVNYLLPEIASRLARDRDGRILGYDYWDLDRRPFDVEPTSDPFFPDHHGTLVASLLLEEAPVAKLVPYRYPRHVMERMAALIEDAAAHHVRVMNLSLSSAIRPHWLAFESAARAHPEMLFVVAAGNAGHDLQSYRAYPAALDLTNMVVVTSASADGHLTRGVNFGPRRVDVMAPGENIVALDFDGARRSVSGSSYATARVSALAACLLADHPQWSAAELKTAVLREVEDSAAPEVRYGFLSNRVLGHRGACRKPLT